MTLAHAKYGIVDKGASPVLHRFGNLAGRSCCGKAIVSVPADTRARFVPCLRCGVLATAREDALAASRDEGLLEWF